MDERKKKIIELIKNAKENDTIDFKEQYYHDSKKSDLIKDIISFANSLAFEDKYIIFGVSDDTRQIVGIADNQIPDISDVNQLIRVYCDPFIDIDIEEFEIESKRVGAIVIKSTNMQKPYVVAKDFAFGGKIYLRAGDIYIRKNANNFRALRNDIEEIYRTRLIIDISSLNNIVKIGAIEIARERKIFARIPINLINSTDNSFVFSKAKIKWIYANSSMETEVCFMDEDKIQFKQAPIVIEKIPFVLHSKSQSQKVLYSAVSEGFCKVIKGQEQNSQVLRIEVILCDARKIEYKTSFTIEAVSWE